MDKSNLPLHPNEVGTYGELAARPNPYRLVILLDPPLEGPLSVLASRAGRRLTPEQISAAEQNAPAVALTQKRAKQKLIKRAKGWLS